MVAIVDLRSTPDERPVLDGRRSGGVARPDAAPLGTPGAATPRIPGLPLLAGPIAGHTATPRRDPHAAICRNGALCAGSRPVVRNRTSPPAADTLHPIGCGVRSRAAVRRSHRMARLLRKETRRR